MPSPLSTKEKAAFVEKLKKYSDTEELKIALSDAVRDGLVFPSPIEDAICSIRQAYQDNKKSSAETFLKSAIDALVTEKVFPAFNKLLQQTSEDYYPGELIHFLAKQLNIVLDEPRLVQVAIKDGKIYWRVKKGDIVIYDRQTAKRKPAFTFTEENSLDMTEDQFREFKDTGKRYGTVKITRELFANYFNEELRNQARAVWDELKEKAILDQKNRLSGIWRMASGETIPLNALTDPKWVISKDQLKDILKTLRGKKSTSFTYLNFIQACKNKFGYINEQQFVSIFNVLWAKNVLNVVSRNSTDAICTVKSLVFKEEDILPPFQLTYNDVVEALYDIANDTKQAELIEKLNATIYRPERSFKSWKETGLVNNSQPDSQESCVKLWDVSLYDDLGKHRNTAEEEKQYGEKLNYDHVPSSDRLRTFTAQETAPLTNEMYGLQRQQTEVNKQIEIGAYRTREEFERLNQSAIALSASLSEKRAFLQREQQRYGEEENWFSVAIPAKLHHQGESFMRSSAEQERYITKPFVQEFETYITMLTTRASDFGFQNQKCVFLLIAAFRHLYRSQVKESSQASRFGQAPHLFFQKKVNKAELDQIILAETKKIISAIS